MPPTAKILIVDDERSITEALEIILSGQGYKVTTASRVSRAVKFLQEQAFDIVFTDLRLPDASGLEFLTQMKESRPETEVVLMTAHGSMDVAIQAIKKGAYYYLEKPFTPDQVVMLIERTLEFIAIREEN